MAVYTNDLRLKEIATGDESGTWGTSTNTNLSLIAEAFSFGTEAITTNLLIPVGVFSLSTLAHSILLAQ